MATFVEGQRVRLLANPDEGWEAERGVVIGQSGPSTLLVQIDPSYRLIQNEDDGLREVTADQLAPE